MAGYERLRETGKRGQQATELSLDDLLVYSKNLEEDWQIGGLIQTVLSTYNWIKFETSQSIEVRTGNGKRDLKKGLVIQMGNKRLLQLIYIPPSVKKGQAWGSLTLSTVENEKKLGWWYPVEVKEVYRLPDQRLGIVFEDYLLETEVNYQNVLIIDKEGNFETNERVPKNTRKIGTAARFVSLGFLKEDTPRRKREYKRRILESFLQGVLSGEKQIRTSQPLH